MIRKSLVVAGVLLVLGSFGRALPAQALDEPEGFADELVAENLRTPTAFAFLPDGSTLIMERDGRLIHADIGSLPATPTEVLQIPDVDLIGERGATAVAVDPDFLTNGYIYVWYAKEVDLTMRLSRFTMVGLVANPVSEFIVWESADTHDGAEFHFGGGIEFGPDGNIWFSMGDRSIPENAQDLTNSSGKIHRVAPDGSIPASNPFDDGVGPNVDSIFTYGQRNPWRIRWSEGSLYVGEVGQDAFEDLNVITLENPGQNFGWPLCEGECTDPAYTDPLWAYAHDLDTSGDYPNATIPNTRFGASITGGELYTAGVYPAEFDGAYFFGDYANRWLSYLTFEPGGTVEYHEFARNTGPLVDVRVGPDGAVYYLSLITDGSVNFSSSGYLRRISYTTGNQAPVIQLSSVSPLSGPNPLQITMTASATDPEGETLSYSWITGDGTVVPGAVATHTFADPGAYSVRVEVSDGDRITSSSSVTVQVGTPPIVTIDSPVDGALFRAGDVLSLQGSSDDLSDLLEWEVVLGHDDHLHPRFVGSGPTASYTVPSADHSFTDLTWFDITLTATDVDGLSSSQTVRVDPDKVDITFISSPGGIPLLLDGVQFNPPRVVDTLIGFNHQISAPSEAVISGRIWEFAGWSAGPSATQTYVVPATSETVTAIFVDAGPAIQYPHYLSDLPFVSSSNGWGPVERDLENGQNLGRDGEPLTLDGIEYAKGLGVNANSSVVVEVPEQCSSFEVVIGIDDNVGDQGSVTFSILVDSNQAFQSPVLTGGDAAVPVSIDVAGASLISLVAGRTADGGDFDHADWADARFLCSVPGPGPDVVVPSFPIQAAQTSNITSISLDLAWAEAVDNLGVAGYKVYVDSQLVATTNSVSVSLTDLAPATTYQLAIQAFDGAGNETLFGPTVSVTTTGVNTPDPDPPTINDDTALVRPGGSVLIDVLANDSDPDGDPLGGVTIIDPPMLGTAQVVGGMIEYTHDGSSATADSLTYRMTDGVFTSALAVVTIDVQNQAPIAVADEVTMPRVESFEIDVLANDVDPDGDELDIEFGTLPSNGEISVVNGVVIYQVVEFADGDSFTYRVSDGLAESEYVEVSIGYFAATIADDLGMFDPATGQWHLDGVDGPFYYGTPGDFPVTGDWDCDGIETVGMYRDSDGFVYLRNSNTTGVADIQFLLGLAGDIPLAGDFNGDGCDTISIYRPQFGLVYIANRLGADNGVIVADYAFSFGNPGDKPFVGDFDGDGLDSIGLHRETTGFVYFTNGSTTAVAPTDNEFFFGDPGDRLMAGNWIEQGFDTVGLFRPSDATVYLRFSNTLGNADATRELGESDWLPVAGHFA